MGTVMQRHRRVAWAVHRPNDFFHKLGSQSEFGTWSPSSGLLRSRDGVLDLVPLLLQQLVLGLGLIPCGAVPNAWMLLS